VALSRARKWTYWLVGGVIAVAVLAVGGTFLYIHVIQGPAPAPLSLSAGTAGPPASAGSSGGASASAAASTGTGGGGLAGTWTVASGSQVGYRVKEVLLGQNNIAVGRTSAVTGSLTVAGTTVTAGSFTAQLDKVVSDESQRDAQFNGRIMDTARYPTGTLKLTTPIRLSPAPKAGSVTTYRATGALTLHGTTRTVSFALSAERTSGGVAISGSIPVVFAQYKIGNPSFGSFVTTANHGTLEFLITFTHA
jgi:polyisoprenoid-binding protein YceI